MFPDQGPVYPVFARDCIHLVLPRPDDGSGTFNLNLIATLTAAQARVLGASLIELAAAVERQSRNAS